MKRYELFTTDKSMYINALLKQARKYPICFLIEHKRKVETSHFHKSSTLTETWECKLTPKVCTTIESAMRKAYSLEVIPLRMYDFQVNSLVFPDKMTLFALECTCRDYQASGFLCSHVITAIYFRNWNVRDFMIIGSSQSSIRRLIVKQFIQHLIIASGKICLVKGCLL